MKFTKLQQEKIEEIIKKEMLTLKEGWQFADRSRRSSIFLEKELMKETTELEQDLSEDSIFSAMEQTAMDVSGECLTNFENELLAHVASVLHNHGLLASVENGDDVYERLVNVDESALQDAQMECASDISLVLDKYATVFAELIKNSYLSNG